MNATHSQSITTNRHDFKVEQGGKTYDVVIYTKENGKFLDDEISFNGAELEYQGAEGQIREDILAHLDKNWETLVK